jgi:formylglycine-generating enzyme required for sulfatase activity
MQTEPHVGMACVPAGAFRMVSDQHNTEERPVRRVKLDAIRIDALAATSAAFAHFVKRGEGQ